MPSALRSDGILSDTLHTLWASSITESTRAAYQSGLNNFLRFLTMYDLCSSNSVNTLPSVSESILLYYIAYCYKSLNMKYTSIKLYLAAIRWAYIAAGLKNPLVDSMGQPLLRVQGVLKGVRKLQGDTVQPRLPITADILTKMCISLQQGMFGPYVDLLLETACTIAFFGFLRCGEFTSVGTVCHPDHSVCLGDVRVSPQGHAFYSHT